MVSTMPAGHLSRAVWHCNTELLEPLWELSDEVPGSPILTAGRAGTHHVEGIGAGFVPPLLVAGSYDEARAIDEDEARQTARRLAREEGIFAGTSTGLNVTGALALARELGPVETVVTRRRVPNGRVGWAAVRSYLSNFSPLAVGWSSV